jgi:hypothetical protein
MANSSIPSREVLEAALQGLQAQQKRLEEQIGQVKSMLGIRLGRPLKTHVASASPAVRPRPKKVMSAAGRRRIAAAQKKRWAAFHKEHSV